MDKKTAILLILTLGIIAVVVKFVFFSPKSYLKTPQISLEKTKIKIEPSKTLKSYTDPSGFTFNYPDNLSLINNEATSSSTYTDINLIQKDINGSLNLKIVDTKFKSLDEWLKSTSSQNSKEVKLGNLKALEVTNNDKILVAALDSGVLFTLEVPFADQKDFWMNVYSKVSEGFSFASPSANTAPQVDNSSDVSFEGEEVVQ